MKAKNAANHSSTISPARVHVGGRTTTRVSKASSQTGPYPDGCIGSDLLKRNYIKYLVERYHRYREADVTFGRTARFRYATLFKNIEAKFKAPTYHIPLSRFDELVDYLHARIDRTLLGRRYNARGAHNFESFDEYKMQMPPPGA